MDNITIKKIWMDGDLQEFSIECVSDFVSVNQKCYINSKELIENSEKIIHYTYNYNFPFYCEFGSKTGCDISAFSLKFEPNDRCGGVKIEVDVEINDNEYRLHRCVFYILSDVGSIEKFANRLKQLVTKSVGEMTILHQ